VRYKRNHAAKRTPETEHGVFKDLCDSRVLRTKISDLTRSDGLTF